MTERFDRELVMNTMGAYILYLVDLTYFERGNTLIISTFDMRLIL